MTKQNKQQLECTECHKRKLELLYLKHLENKTEIYLKCFECGLMQSVILSGESHTKRDKEPEEQSQTKSSYLQ